MICPNCNSEIRENISLRKGYFFNHKKVYTIFCFNCDLKKEIVIKISKENYNTELIQLSNVINITKQIYDTTNKKMSNRYNKELEI